MATNEVMRWQGRVFLPVLHAVGRVESMGDKRVQNMSALVMEVADGTLHGMQLGGEELVRVAWALASTLAALNNVGFIHGDLKPLNVLWKARTGCDILSGWPMLTDFGASQHFPSFQLGRAISPSEEVHTSQWTPKFAALEVHESGGRVQTVRSDMFAWAATIRAVSQKDVIVEPIRARLESILEECGATDPKDRPKDFSEIARCLEQPSYVMWGKELQTSQRWLKGEALSNSNRTAVEAVTLLAEERDVWCSSGACSSKEVSEAYLFLSIAHLHAEKPDGAVKALQKSVVWHAEHALRPEWLANLGVAYGNLGDASKKRDYLERALRILESHYGPEHPVVAKTLASLGVAYGDLGDASKERDCLERALRIKEGHYGPEHPEVAKTLANLGNAYRSLGDASKR
eukprot:1601750-Amphidinium_carterae.1